VGGMQLDTPEHAVQLLLQAFEAMKEAQTSKPLHVEGNATWSARNQQLSWR
jgi:hypothetical protein